VRGNLQLVIERLAYVYVYDNSYLRGPYRRVAVFENGTPIEVAQKVPTWFAKPTLR
jgi:hypothetical protein